MHKARCGWVDHNHRHLSLNNYFSGTLFMGTSDRHADKSSVVWLKTLQMKDDLGFLHFVFLEAWRFFSRPKVSLQSFWCWDWLTEGQGCDTDGVPDIGSTPALWRPRLIHRHSLWSNESRENQSAAKQSRSKHHLGNEMIWLWCSSWVSLINV